MVMSYYIFRGESSDQRGVDVFVLVPFFFVLFN